MPVRHGETVNLQSASWLSKEGPGLLIPDFESNSFTPSTVHLQQAGTTMHPE